MLLFNIVWSFVFSIIIAGGLAREWGPWAILLFIPIFLLFLVIDLAAARLLFWAESKNKKETNSDK